MQRRGMALSTTAGAPASYNLIPSLYSRLEIGNEITQRRGMAYVRTSGEGVPCDGVSDGSEDPVQLSQGSPTVVQPPGDSGGRGREEGEGDDSAEHPHDAGLALLLFGHLRRDPSDETKLARLLLAEPAVRQQWTVI